MRIIKDFNQFIKEGAYINSNGDIELSLKNDPQKPKELLKSSDYLVPGRVSKTYTVSSGEDDKLGNVKYMDVYYGLYPLHTADAKKKDGYYKIPDEDQLTFTKSQWSEVTGDDDYNDSQEDKTIVTDSIKMRYMDFLKAGKFVMAPGETLGNFINSSVLKCFNPIGKSLPNIKYIVKVESKKDLVNMMADSLHKIYPDSQIINLSKKVYTDPYSVVNIDSAVVAGKREEEGWSEEERKKHLKNLERLMRGVDFELISKGWSEYYSRKFLSDLIKKLELNPGPFKIQSSGSIRGNIRKFLAPKYDLEREALKAAIADCLIVREGMKEGDLPKMVILDDNYNTGMDFTEISEGIKKYVESETFKNDSGFLEEDRISSIKKNIMGYVLYKYKLDKSKSSNPRGPNQKINVVIDENSVASRFQAISNYLSLNKGMRTDTKEKFQSIMKSLITYFGAEEDIFAQNKIRSFAKMIALGGTRKGKSYPYRFPKDI